MTDGPDLSPVEFHVQTTDKRSMTARLDDRRAVHHQGFIHPVVRVAAEKNVDACDFCREFHVLRKAKMREHHHEFYAFPFSQRADVAR